MSKITIIGDIHGCFHTLEALYDKIKDKATEVYSVGDLVDRGKFSKDVVQFCIDKGIKPVRGNHEDMLLKALVERGEDDYEAGSLNRHFINGGRTTMASYTGSDLSSVTEYKEALEKSGHLEFIKSFPIRYEFSKLILTHAGITEGTDDTIWHRRPVSKLDKLQIFGHTPIEQVDHQKGWYANIDTGCVYISYGYGMLTAVVVDTGKGEITEIIQEQNRELEYYVSPNR